MYLYDLFYSYHKKNARRGKVRDLFIIYFVYIVMKVNEEDKGIDFKSLTMNLKITKKHIDNMINLEEFIPDDYKFCLLDFIEMFD